MLRITKTATANAVVMKLEGTLREPWIEEVRRACESEGKPVALDLADVHYVDADGEALLLELIHRRGVPVAASSNFVAELLQLVKP